MLLNGQDNPRKLLLPDGGSGPPSNKWYLRPTRVIVPNGISIGSAVFVWVPNAMLYNALSMRKKTPKTAPSPRDLVTLPEEDPATAISNTHRKKIDKDRASGSGDILADRQTDTHTQTCSSQYFVTASAGDETTLIIFDQTNHQYITTSSKRFRKEMIESKALIS